MRNKIFKCITLGTKIDVGFLRLRFALLLKISLGSPSSFQFSYGSASKVKCDWFAAFFLTSEIVSSTPGLKLVPKTSVKCGWLLVFLPTCAIVSSKMEFSLRSSIYLK